MKGKLTNYVGELIQYDSLIIDGHRVDKKWQFDNIFE